VNSPMVGILLCKQFEAQVLDGLDFKQFPLKWIVVEANCPEEIEIRLGDRFELIAMLSHHDRLYNLI